MTQLIHDYTLDQGQLLAGKLRIIRKLGFGGMGAVYEVEHEITRHRRALKVLHPQLADMPAVVERFLREASAAGRIGNAHIVETFDAGKLDSGAPYIVMELLKGRTLADLLAGSGPLDLKRACDLLVQACDGVSAAHAAGIVHRDLKPENLFLTSSMESFVKILDFGISKFDAVLTGVEGLTLEGSPMGTPYYMSPEQVKGQKTVDTRTDVYALGVVLYECLTARRPFDGDSLPELIFQIAQGNYVRPTQLRPELPQLVDDVVQTAMAMDPAQRYASAQQLADALSRLLAAPERTVMFVPATTSKSSVPPTPSQRLGPAMTPGVFSRSSPSLRQSSTPRSSWKWPTFVIGVLVLLSITWAWSHSYRRGPDTKPSVAALSRDSKAIPAVHLVPSSNDVGAPLSRSGASAPEAPASKAEVQESSGQSKRALVVPAHAPSGASAASPGAPRVKPIPSPAAHTSRVSAQGLAEDNPFK